MTTQDALDHFGGMKNLARKLNVYPQAIYKWGEYPPEGRQYQLQALSDGALTVEDTENDEASA